MAVLKNNAYQTAVWGAKNNFITGLDPLGLQNTSEATYTRLLPGITNLTNRIRYYGFYCWLLEYYAKNIRDTDPKEQNRFARRAELMLALIMQSKDPDYNQVTGSRYAGKMIEARTDSFFDLTGNADQDQNTKTYWMFSAGAFGQYYAGAMRELGLILRNDQGNFICSNEEHFDNINGVVLAKAYETSVSEDARKLFIENIQKGQLQIAQIDLLHKEFALNGIILESSEWQLYTELLLGPDIPAMSPDDKNEASFHRRQTIKFFLKFLESGEDFQGTYFFPLDIYQAKGHQDDQETETLQLWYFYFLSELWHFGAGAAFWGMLHMLDTSYHQIHLPLFVRNYTEEIQNYLLKELGVSENISVREALSAISAFEDSFPNQINDAVWSGDFQMAGGCGIALLLSIYNNNLEELDSLQLLVISKGVLRDGNVLEFFEHLENYMDEPLSDFIHDFILRNLIYRHQFVALRKTGSGTQSTLKFLLEENFIRHIESFAPRFTSPRLNALYHILQDLGLVNLSGELTQEGSTFLNTRF